MIFPGRYSGRDTYSKKIDAPEDINDEISVKHTIALHTPLSGSTAPWELILELPASAVVWFEPLEAAYRV